jgi:hypothetical protein
MTYWALNLIRGKIQLLLLRLLLKRKLKQQPGKQL